jgi:surface antigen
MRIFTRVMLMAMLGLGVSAIAPQVAQAQLVSPFGRATGWVPLAPEDKELLKKAIRDALEAGKIGDIVSWESATSGRAGHAVVTETFEVEGRKCAQVTHRFTKGPGRTYSAPLCKVEDGSWKLAF